MLRVQATGAGGPGLATTTGLVVPYSPEYRPTADGPAMLDRLAALTGGRVLSPEDLRAPFAPGPRPVRSTIDLWPLLLLLAIFLFPLDVGLRRVSVARRELARSLDVVRRRLGVAPRPEPVAAPAPATQMQSLFGAKQRVRDRTRPMSPTPPGASVAVPEPPTLGQAAGQAQVLQSTVGEGEDSPRQAVGEAPGSATRQGDQQPGETLAARLRRARERR